MVRGKRVERSITPPGPAQPALHRRLHRRARPQPLRQGVGKETAAAKWWVKRQRPLRQGVGEEQSAGRDPRDGSIAGGRLPPAAPASAISKAGAENALRARFKGF